VSGFGRKKLTWLKKMIALCRVPMMKMMTLMMSMMIKSSCWSLKKLISKPMKLQKRYVDLLCPHKELINSYALLEATHEEMVTSVKSSQPHTCTCAPLSIDSSCTNSCHSQANPSYGEHVLVETCDDLIASENDELKRENEIPKMELSQLKGKCHVQPSQYNHENMVKKLEKGSTVTCAKLPQINLKTSYQKVDKTKI
jgi:hypothetical protein